jgi:hypothetical protein
VARPCLARTNLPIEKCVTKRFPER